MTMIMTHNEIPVTSTFTEFMLNFSDSDDDNSILLNNCKYVHVLISLQNKLAKLGVEAVKVIENKLDESKTIILNLKPIGQDFNTVNSVFKYDETSEKVIELCQQS